MENKNSTAISTRLLILLGILALVVIGVIIKAVMDTNERESVFIESAAKPFGPIHNKSESAVP
jgi:hypothetical protein